MPDLLIPGAAVAAITTVLLSLTGAIGILFRALLASKNAAIQREQELTDKLLPTVEEIARTQRQLLEGLQRLLDHPTRSARGG